jgi:thioredoxin 1
MISPVLEKLTADPSVKTRSGQALDLVTVDVDQQTTLAQEFAVRLWLMLSGILSPANAFVVKVNSLPTVIAFQDGVPISKFVGAMPEASVRNFLGTL